VDDDNPDYELVIEQEYNTPKRVHERTKQQEGNQYCYYGIKGYGDLETNNRQELNKKCYISLEARS
jgi:hypothetical protein